MEALIALEDGNTFTGRSFTGEGETSGEAVFNTGMTGYQEILTDPSYSGQMITMTYPLIGNYGVNENDVESGRVQASGFIVKEYRDRPSNFRATDTLANYLKKNGILGVEGVDTRALTRHIRNAGAMRAFISTRDLDPGSLVKRAQNIDSMAGLDLTPHVTTEKPYYWKDGKPVDLFPQGGKEAVLDRSVWKHGGSRPRVAAFDYGIKYNILRLMESAGMEIVVVPAKTDARTIKAMEPDGIFLSNGPGDPEPVTYAIETIQNLFGFCPIFGICLGHQLLALAIGAKTYKLKFGHRGINQPVKNFRTGRIEITSQNHGFAVDVDSLDENVAEITHINLNDETLEGFKSERHAFLAVQYHPEASPGPHDARYLFEDFLQMIRKSR